jgi:ribokinase
VDEARECALRLLACGLRRVIVTLGANGALCAGAEGARHIPPYAVSPVDTTGAGDAFIGSFACFLAGGCAEAEAIARANLYAALSTLAVGTQASFVTRERFEAEWATGRGQKYSFNAIWTNRGVYPERPLVTSRNPHRSEV